MNRHAYYHWAAAVIFAMLAVVSFMSCGTTYTVTDHRHMERGKYYYRLNDSIDYITRERGMGKHRCDSVVRLKGGRVRRY